MGFLRGKVPGEYGYVFQPGQAQMVRGGADVLSVSAGLTVDRVCRRGLALPRGDRDLHGCGGLDVTTHQALKDHRNRHPRWRPDRAHRLP